MRKLISAAMELGKVFVLFTGFTVLFYYAIIWMNSEYENYHRYDQPEGAALRVSNMIEDKEENIIDRLLFFYLNGE
ncbi:DUF4227 family protein [Bacillus lacus]|uniref:DUF4227 family protein n=1 Tax=Metabacillus lacus TaxID=1983721 RepID=A0A7X2J3M2_9BACI|nr:YqzK family protein [Metabacillus lacus]MRX74323.1 DUF4227 family protein [Metabacillus lacus]